MTANWELVTLIQAELWEGYVHYVYMLAFVISWGSKLAIHQEPALGCHWTKKHVELLEGKNIGRVWRNSLELF
jgi:hypothetical protein